jgi:Leucine-rich repeat (LRR) protein
VGNNLLKRLPDSIGTLTALTDLHAENNQLTCLPESFVSLSRLRTLVLDSNPFQEFPCSFMHTWTDLVTLSLDTENVVTLPDGAIYTSTELMPLEIVSQGIPKCVEYRQRLRQSLVTGNLDLSVLALWFVPFSVTKMQLLTTLNLTGNNILMLPGWYFCLCL